MNAVLRKRNYNTNFKDPVFLQFVVISLKIMTLLTERISQIQTEKKIY